VVARRPTLSGIRAGIWLYIEDRGVKRRQSAEGSVTIACR
jgi:hypothetical protein